MIAVYDVREHRIPNIMLLFALLISMFYSIENNIFIEHGLGFVVAFAFGMTLFVFKAMSAGDVKLLSVVGYVVGLGSLLDTGYYILIASGMMAAMYLSLNYANTTSLRVVDSNQFHNRYNNKVTMPFAPSVVIGLAMYSYFT